jgi:oligosaccharide repeat unit polymerase
MTILLLVILFLLLFCALTCAQIYHDKSFSFSGFYLSPMLILNIGWVLYGLTPLLFISHTEDRLSSQDLNYIVVISASIIFWVAGIFIGASATKTRPDHSSYHSNNKCSDLGSTRKILISIIFLLSFYIYKLYDNPIQYLTQQYGLYNAENVTSLISSIPFLIAGLLFYLSIFNRSSGLVVFSIIISLFFALGGNRNLSAFIIIGVLFSVYRNVKIKPIIILLFFSGIIASASFLAVAREYGIGNVLTGESTDFSISEVYEFSKRYNEGEFGTLKRTLEYVNEKGGDFDYYFPGFSYLLSPIVNLIPTSLFPSRPYTIATEFTFHYWGAKEDFVEGLGFSPIAEGIINFGYIFFVIPILITAVLLTMISIRSMAGSPKYYWLIITTCVAAASLNFFRIDFALYTKFILISFLSAYIAFKLSKIRFTL